MLAVSPGMAASAVLTSAVVGVIVDGARNTRLLLAELRAK
jgi:hypothetical protein